MHERTRFSIIRMAEELAVDNKVHHDSEDDVGDAHDKTSRETNAQGEEEDHRERKKSVSPHIIFCGVFAVFWSLVLRKWPTRRTSAIEGVSELTHEKNNEASAGTTVSKG